MPLSDDNIFGQTKDPVDFEMGVEIPTYKFKTC